MAMPPESPDQNNFHPDDVTFLRGLDDQMADILGPKESLDPAELDELMATFNVTPETPLTPDSPIFRDIEKSIDDRRTPLARELIAIWNEPELPLGFSLLEKICAFGQRFRVMRSLSKLFNIDYPEGGEEQK